MWPLASVIGHVAVRVLFRVGMRAFPTTQLQDLTRVLSSHALPMACPAVHQLVQQLLYHVGEIDVQRDPHSHGGVSDARASLTWKWDLTAGDAVRALYAACEAAIDDLANRPRNHDEFPLVATVATFIRHWDDRPCRDDLRRRCASVALAWSASIEEDITRATAAVSVPALRARQYLFYMYALLCHEGGYVERGDC